jgi:hypothetical protein
MNLANENGVVALMVRYGFDLGGQSAVAVVRSWSCKYDPSFLLLAVIESLHLGRYKAVSVEQVLNSWQRRGQAIPHFSPEFAKMVSGEEEAALLLTTEDEQTTAFLDEEIALFSASEIAEAHQSTEFFELSDPALDEGLPETAPPKSQLTTSQHQVSLDLTPTSYPPTAQRPPRNNWHQTAPLEELFTPSAQVSQFYYKLRAMAASAPQRDPEEPLQAAEG